MIITHLFTKRTMLIRTKWGKAEGGGAERGRKWSFIETFYNRFSQRYYSLSIIGILLFFPSFDYLLHLLLSFACRLLAKETNWHNNLGMRTVNVCTRDHGLYLLLFFLHFALFIFIFLFFLLLLYFQRREMYTGGTRKGKSSTLWEKRRHENP